MFTRVDQMDLLPECSLNFSYFTPITVQRRSLKLSSLSLGLMQGRFYYTMHSERFILTWHSKDFMHIYELRWVLPKPSQFHKSLR